MTNISSRQVTALAHMAIKQAKILRSDGLAREARQLAKLGQLMASSSVLISSPVLVPATIRRENVRT